MENQETSVEIFEKFKWNIENFSHLNFKKISSKTFDLGGYPWRINLYPRGANADDSLSVYLEAVKTPNMSEGWSRHVKYKLAVFNQLDANLTITRESNQNEFQARQMNWGFSTFMSLVELHDPEKGFIVKDNCIVGVEIFVIKSTNENQVNQATKIKLETDVPRQEDFSTVGQQEGICSDSPSLNEPQRKRSRKFEDLAFSSFGKLLYFLKTRKVRDMNDQGCKDLQVLWEELKKYRFDLSWLEPHVQSALGAKSYVEKAVEVEKLKENVVALELETERVMAKLVAAKVNLDTERELLKAKGFEERDLDSELGRGSWIQKT